MQTRVHKRLWMLLFVVVWWRKPLGLSVDHVYRTSIYKYRCINICPSQCPTPDANLTNHPDIHISLLWPKCTSSYS